MFVIQEKSSHNGCSFISFWGCQGAPMLVSELPKMFQNPNEILMHSRTLQHEGSRLHLKEARPAAAQLYVEDYRTYKSAQWVRPAAPGAYPLAPGAHFSSRGAHFSPRETPCSSRRHTPQLQGTQWTGHTIQVSKAHPAAREGTSFNSRNIL